MDALAAYGSDDDDDSSQSENTPEVKATKSALDGLADYSDDDEDDEDDRDSTDKFQTVVASEKMKEASAVQEKAAAKRKRKWDSMSDAQEEGSSNKELLPPPPLGSSLVEWNKDYTTKYRVSNDTGYSQELADKLARLKQSSTQNFAQELQSQKEFHNPHFFQNVVSHFGIKNSLGNTAAFTDVFEKYEYNVVASEEQSRLRKQQQQQGNNM